MTIPDEPPRGLRWVDSMPVRLIVALVAFLALAGSVWATARQQAYVNCVAGQQTAAAVRTAAIARATDNERRAQRLLIENVKPENVAGLRAAVLDAYDATDRVRSANPPPEPGGC